MPSIGDQTLRRIVAAVGEYVKQDAKATVLEVQTIGEEVITEINALRAELDKERKGDPAPVPSGMIDHNNFWRSLFGLLAAVGLRFDDLYAYVIKKGAKGK